MKLQATKAAKSPSTRIGRLALPTIRTGKQAKPAPAKAAPHSNARNPAIPSTRKNSTKPSKLETIVAMLRQKRGANIDELAAATGWQKHSVRGAIFGAIKTTLGSTVISERKNGVRIYRIAK